MALSINTTPVALFGGLDTKTSAKYVAASNQLSLQNVRQFSPQSIRKRWGQTALSRTIGNTTASIGVGKALGVLNNELLEFDGQQLYSYAETQKTWLSRGNITETLVDVNPVIRSGGSVNGISSVKTAVAEVYAWEDTRGGVYAAARDSLSGSFTLTPFLIDATASQPTVIASSGFIYVFYHTPNAIKAAQFNAQALNTGIQQTFTLTAGSDTSLGNYFVTGNDALILVGLPYNSDFTGQLRVYNSSLQLQVAASTTYTTPTNTTVRAQSIAGPSGVFQWVITQLNTTAPTQITYTYGTATTSAITVLKTSSQVFPGLTYTSVADLMPTLGYPGTGTSTQIALTAQVQVSTTAAPAVLTTYDSVVFSSSAALVTTPSNLQYGLQIAAGAAFVNGIPYFVAISPLNTIAGKASQNPSFYLCSGASASSNITTILQRFSGSLAYQNSVKPWLTVMNGALFVGLAQRIALRADASGTIYSQSGLSSVNFTFPAVSGTQVVQFNQEANINCGNTYSYDGTQIVEAGFWGFPEGITAVIRSNANSGLSAGLYIYAVTYEWTDAAGNVVLSAPSYPSPQNGDNTFGVTVTAGAQVNLTIPYLNTTLKSGVQVCIYRTTANQSTPFYKVAAIDNTPGLSGAQSFLYADRSSDVLIESQQFLYAPPDGSGEIENDCPPPFLYMVATKTRMFGIAQDNRTQLWYSKPLALGRPAEWSQLQIVPIETDGGPVTGLSYLNTQAVVFKENRIYYLPGDGPNSAGQPANGFPQTLATVSTTSGCVNNKSILPNSNGLYYQSALGLETLNLSLSNDPSFGLAVQKFAQLPFTGTATVVAQNQLRWATSTDTMLVFDYIVKGWNTYTNYSAVAYTIWGDTPVRLTSNGTVYFEDTTTYLDAGVGVQQLIETAWLKPAQIAQGFAAVWYAMILGEYLSPHNLVIEVAYDYIDAPAHYYIWNATANGNFGTYGSGSPYGIDPVYGANNATPYTASYQPRIALQRQVCEAIKFKIYDTGITGASCELNEIALQLGVVGGLNRVPGRQQV